MATVTGMTAEKILELTDDLLESVAIDDETGVMTLRTRGGQTLTAGNVDTAKKAVDLAYPVGSVYISTVATNPATLFGVGTWQAFGTGKTLIGVDPADTDFNAPNKTGGEKSHKLTPGEMPIHSHTIAHQHSLSNHTHGTVPHSHTIDYQARDEYPVSGGSTAVTDIQGKTNGFGTSYSGSTSSSAPGTGGPSVDATGASNTANSGNAGGDGFHNNLPPYVTCYIWKRTA